MMDNELVKWRERFESKNGRQPSDEEFESARKRIERNVAAQRQRRLANQNEQIEANKEVSQHNPNSQYQPKETEKQPPRHDWGMLWAIGLAALFIIGGIIAFKIGSAHGTSLW